jgi:hypothetical protein
VGPFSNAHRAILQTADQNLDAVLSFAEIDAEISRLQGRVAQLMSVGVVETDPFFFQVGVGSHDGPIRVITMERRKHIT